jgi:hypothetical protein
VRFIGVHTPETPGERVPENVEKKVRELKISHPVLLDPEGENWRRWGQQWWPTVYLIDRRGRVRYRWAGELEFQNAGGEAKLGGLVEQLLKERP